MQIKNQTIKILKPQNSLKLTSDYVENILKESGYKFLRWAITEECEKYYKINFSQICE